MNRKILFCYAICASSASYAVPLHKSETTSLNANFTIVGMPLYSSYDYDKHDRKDVLWGEAYVKGSVSGETDLWGGTLYGSIGVFSSKVVGDGDAAGISKGNESYTKFNDSFIGWRNDVIDLSTGRQTYSMADNFLISGDQLNYGEKYDSNLARSGLYYLAQPVSFANTVIAKVHPNNKINLEAFHLESDNNGQGNPIINGVNSEYAFDQANSLGLAYFKLNNVDTEIAGGLFAGRKDMDVYNVRAKTNLGIEPLKLSVGYAKEKSALIDAYTWYGEAEYSFKDTKYSPTISYRYSQFSGDKIATDKSEAFDPLFYGATVSGSNWVQGEISGTFAGPFNSNMRAHRVTARLTINNKLSINSRFYHMSEDISGDHIADEINVYFEVMQSENLFFMPIVGLWKPGKIAEIKYGEKVPQTFLGLLCYFSY
ncbi:hypothetical protein [Acinetobacter seifertii]|uniref:hypothetical protein n=1 Tax=Acinetobacter seifertii TaxID=1530123 RepID=UPI00066666CE|nr:hypothetical protein [Acinetobacter seifertii]